MNELDLARAVGRYLDDEMSADEERAFLAAIQADPELRAAFVAHVRLSVRLETAHREPGDPGLVERTKALMKAKDPVQAARTVGEIRRRVDRRARARRRIVWAIAAASVLLATLVAVLRGPARAPRSETRPEIVRSEPEPRPQPSPAEAPPGPAPVAPPEKRPEPSPVPEPLPPRPLEPAPAPTPVPDPAPLPTLPAPEPPAPPRKTTVAAARIESLIGDAFLAGGRDALRAGQDLLPGQGLRSTGGAVIVFADATRVELGPDTTLRALFDHDSSRGKRLLLDRGLLRAQVPKQPADRPLELQTPHAQATVLGTTFSLLVGSRTDGATRLDVAEGRVQIRRSGQAASADVLAGHYAIVTAVADPVAYPNPVFIDLNDFGTGREAEPAQGPVRRLYRDVSLRSTGGTCVAAPGVGTALDGVLPLSPGTWHLWIRYRDTDLGPVSFRIEIDGRTAATIVGEGKPPVEKWNWRRVTFEAKAKAVRLTLRSTSEALKFDKGDNTYAVVNRWDAIVLARDPGFDPEKEF